MNQNEARLAKLLDDAGIEYEAQGVVAGHHVDFLIRGRYTVALDANGVWWHTKPKIMACDTVKILRVSREAVVLGVWDWRIKSQPEVVIHAVRQAMDYGIRALWDWAVEPSWA